MENVGHEVGGKRGWLASSDLLNDIYSLARNRNWPSVVSSDS